MNEENRKDLQEKLKRVEEIRTASAESIELKQKTIQQEAQNISKLQKIERDSGLIIDLYSNKSEDQFNHVSDESYSMFTQPITDLVASGTLVEQVRDYSRTNYADVQSQFPVLSAVGSTTSSAASTAGIIAVSFTQFFTDGQDVITRYQPEDQLDEDIDYINSQLPSIHPNVTEDFEHFIAKYRIFERSKSDYQDLIGIRSTFFFGLMFEFSKTNYAVEHPRKEAIKKFVFGSTPYDSSTEGLIENAKNLYRELSIQDASTGMSVKVGNITPQYAEGMFRRIISVMASLLKLRSRFFRQ